MLLFTCFAVISIVKSEEYVTYSTSQGNIRGLIKSARNGDSFNAFLGVPFARPPIGDLRWQPPQPSPKWEGTLDATKMADVCTQDSLYEPAKMDGSEDWDGLDTRLVPKIGDTVPRAEPQSFRDRCYWWRCH